MAGSWRPELLTGDHQLDDFDCGIPLLDQWLVTQSRRAQAADTARTYVWTTPEGRVVAYYSIAPTQIFRSELSSGLAGGYSVVPAYLLARLALDRSIQRQGHGADLLVDALTTILHAADTGAGRLIVVDAIDDRAAAFYRHFDFVPVGGTRNRLVMKVATARKALGIGSLRFTPSPDVPLASIVFQLPDGSAVPSVVTMSELELIMGRMSELAQQRAGDPDAVINFNEVLVEVLGRDPFRDPEAARGTRHP
jgi:GNAT superfamily N-acetyltransferase